MGGDGSIGDENAAKLETFKKWIVEEPQLPQHIDKLLVERFLCAVGWNVDKAKKLIVLNYQMRTTNAHIFLDRDPLSEESKEVFRITDMIPLPKLTAERYLVILLRLAEFNTDYFHFNNVIQAFFMFSDTRLALPDGESGRIAAGEIPIFDMKGFSLRHLTKIVFSTLRLYMKFTQEAHPVRLKQIHIINCSSFLDRVMSMVKPLIRGEVFKLIHFHLPGSDTLYKFVPQELLPEEYGGKASPTATLKQEFIAKMSTMRDYLGNDDNWRLNIKTNNNNCGNTKNVAAISNFRSLSID